jgi:hypothetical protein
VRGRTWDSVLSEPGSQVLSACARIRRTGPRGLCPGAPYASPPNSAPPRLHRARAARGAEVNAGVDPRAPGLRHRCRDPQQDLRYRWSSNREGVLAQGPTPTTRRLSHGRSTEPHPHRLGPLGPHVHGHRAPHGEQARPWSPLPGGPGRNQLPVRSVPRGACPCRPPARPPTTPMSRWAWSGWTASWAASAPRPLVPVFAPRGQAHVRAARHRLARGAVGRDVPVLHRAAPGHDRLVDPLVTGGDPISSAPAHARGGAVRGWQVLDRLSAPRSCRAAALPCCPSRAQDSPSSGWRPPPARPLRGHRRRRGAVHQQHVYASTAQGRSPASGEAVRTLLALESPDLLLLGTTRASSYPARATPPRAVPPHHRRPPYPPGAQVRQVLASSASTARELKLWAATSEGLAELTAHRGDALRARRRARHLRAPWAPSLPDEDVRALARAPRASPTPVPPEAGGTLGRAGPALRAPPWN